MARTFSLRKMTIHAITAIVVIGLGFLGLNNTSHSQVFAEPILVADVGEVVQVIVNNAEFVFVNNDAEEDEAEVKEEDDDDAEMEGMQLNNGNRFQINEENFSQWVFNGTVQGNDVRKQLELSISARLASFEELKLSNEQKDRLENAAQGDIQRFLEEYDRVRRSIKFGMVSQDEWQKIWQKISPLQMRFQSGLYGGDSLYHKTIKSVLSPTQLKLYEEVEEKRRKRQHLASAQILIAQIENLIPLTKDQRARLKNLILEETKLPASVGRNTYPHLNLLAQMKSISDKKFAEIFTAGELKQLRQSINQAQGYANINQGMENLAGVMKSE